MTDKKKQDQASNASPPEKPDPAEAKRLAARRRFIKDGAAAGSGAIVLTLYHRKGYAGGGKKKVNLSSAEACLSIGGTPGKKPVKVKDSITPYVFDAQGKKHKNFVEKIECTVPATPK